MSNPKQDDVSVEAQKSDISPQEMENFLNEYLTGKTGVRKVQVAPPQRPAQKMSPQVRDGYVSAKQLLSSTRNITAAEDVQAECKTYGQYLSDRNEYTVVKFDSPAMKITNACLAIPSSWLSGVMNKAANYGKPELSGSLDVKKKGVSFVKALDGLEQFGFAKVRRENVSAEAVVFLGKGFSPVVEEFAQEKYSAELAALKLGEKELENLSEVYNTHAPVGFVGVSASLMSKSPVVAMDAIKAGGGMGYVYPDGKPNRVASIAVTSNVSGDFAAALRSNPGRYIISASPIEAEMMKSATLRDYMNFSGDKTRTVVSGDAKLGMIVPRKFLGEAEVFFDAHQSRKGVREAEVANQARGVSTPELIS